MPVASKRPPSTCAGSPGSGGSLRSLRARFRQRRPFFAGNPASPDAWRVGDRARASASRRRDAVAAVIARNPRRAARPTPARRRGRCSTSRGHGGDRHRPAGGAFGGPLFTLLKAITAIQLARTSVRGAGVPTVAVFWVEAEDHDWEEVRGVTVLDQEFRAANAPSRPARVSRAVARRRTDSSTRRRAP